MEQNSPGEISNKSEINYDYATIKITQSRIDKGLLAIPVSLGQYFPLYNVTIQVHLDDASASQPKQYSSYTSSTRECRIGGLREWFQRNGIESDDEIVVQFLDKKHFIYRLIPERDFIRKTRQLENDFDISASDQEASSKVADLAHWTQVDKNRVIINEYIRLTNTLPSMVERRLAVRGPGRTRESAPSNIRTLLEEIYKGHCQVCDFWFLNKDGSPYFEIHHIDPAKGHHPQNLLVVCGNCHNQFEYASVKHEFDDDWLIGVRFNEMLHAVTQIALKADTRVFLKTLFI